MQHAEKIGQFLLPSLDWALQATGQAGSISAIPAKCQNPFLKILKFKISPSFFSWPLTLDLCSPGLHGTFCITLAMKVTVLSHDPFGTNSKVEEWVKSYVISADFFTLKLNFFIEMKVHLCTQPAQEPSTDRGLSWVLTSKSQFLFIFCISKIWNECI